VNYRELRCIELDDHAPVFNIHEDVPRTIRDRSFGLSAKGECANDGISDGVDGCGILATSIEGEYALGR
jgi:hypothetical protein